MRRRVFSLASTVSLALLLGASVFWMRSYSLGDEFTFYREPRTFGVYSSKGLIHVAWGQLVSRDYPPPSGWKGSFWPFHREVDVIEMDVRRGTVFGFAVARWGWQQPGGMARGWSLTSPW